jgi:hypothetical protein
VLGRLLDGSQIRGRQYGLEERLAFGRRDPVSSKDKQTIYEYVSFDSRRAASVFNDAVSKDIVSEGTPVHYDVKFGKVIMRI